MQIPLLFISKFTRYPPPSGYESLRGAPLSFFSPTPLLIIASLSTRRFCQHERQTGQIADEKSTSCPGFFISPPQRGDDPGNDVEEKLGRPQRMWRELTGSLSKDDSNGNDDVRKQWSDWLNEEKSSCCTCGTHFSTILWSSLPNDNVKFPNLRF